jgi:DNA-binding MarR family transcriptional regulator
MEQRTVINQPGNKEALALWYNVLLQSVRGHQFDLSARQTAIMLTIYTIPSKHTVRGLASHLKVSKPAICRAIDSLSKWELVERKVDQTDRRNVFIEPTPKGHEFLGGFSESIMNALVEIS